MREIETDYLVVGAGTSGMGFADVLLSESDAEIVIVDRQARPGGHWLGAYPFVRLHQPSATYGVNSTPLGRNRIDEVGPNAGFYERASAPEICDYFGRVLEQPRRRLPPHRRSDAGEGAGKTASAPAPGYSTPVSTRIASSGSGRGNHG